MTNVIVESAPFDLCVTQSVDWQGVPRYIVRYGLQTNLKDTIEDALREFMTCMKHAMMSAGLCDLD